MQLPHRYEIDAPHEAAGIIRSRILPEVHAAFKYRYGDDAVTCEETATEEGFRWVFTGPTTTIRALGVHHRTTGFTAAPGLVEVTPPPPPQTCLICNTRRHHNYAYIDTGDGFGWYGTSCVDKDVALTRVYKHDMADLLEPVRVFLVRFGQARRVETTRVVAEAMAAIDQHGYVSANQWMSVGKPATKSCVETALDASPDSASYAAENFLLPAVMVRAWAMEADPGDSEFMQNLLRLAQQPTVTIYSLGMLCFLPEAYRRAEQENTKPGEPPFEYADGHVGARGQRIESVLTIRNLRRTRSGYLIVEASNNENKKIIWFTDVSTWTVGVSVNVRYTVKRFDEYRGQKSTVVNRVNLRPT